MNGPAMTDLEARAHWHLDIGYPPYPYPVEQPPEFEDYYDGDYDGHHTCWKCGGEGSEVVCFDDLCRGGGHCIHGDGERMCPECHGEGFL